MLLVRQIENRGLSYHGRIRIFVNDSAEHAAEVFGASVKPDFIVLKCRNT